MDFRYLLDLYTLTFDEDETVDEIKVHTHLPPGEIRTFWPSSLSNREVQMISFQPCQTIDMLETSQDPNLSMSTASTSPPRSSSPNAPQPPHDFLSMMAPAAPEDDVGVDSSVAVGPLSLGSALSNQQVRQLLRMNAEEKFCDCNEPDISESALIPAIAG